jgi:hypothetical protein
LQRRGHDAQAFRSGHPGRPGRQVTMEIAAVVLIGSVVLWFVEEASSGGA